ncbi:MAG TPA: hypothetical protein VIU86_10045 [Gaiellaceae bacterium]
MTNHVARLYALALAVLVFFVAWAVVSAHPWQAAKADPRITALAAREQRLHRQSLVVKQVVEKRWRAYRVALAARNKQIAARRSQIALQQRRLAQRRQQIAAIQASLASQVTASRSYAPASASASGSYRAPAPSAAAPVRVVTLPPLTVTRTS